MMRFTIVNVLRGQYYGYHGHIYMLSSGIHQMSLLLEEQLIVLLQLHLHKLCVYVVENCK